MMARDFLYKHEEMNSETDAEFVAMCKQADRDGVWNSGWSKRLIEIAERGVDKPKRFWVV